MQAFHNGVLVDAQDLSVSIYDFGFARGYALFENMRVYGDHVLHLDQHLDRLFGGAEVLALKMPVEKEVLKLQVLELLKVNGYDDSSVRIYVTQGKPRSFDLSIGGDMNFVPEVFVINERFDVYSEEFPYHERYYTQGVKVASVPTVRPLPEAKTTCYIPSIKAGRDVMASGYGDVLYVGNDGFVTECSRSNIFFTQKGKLITPAKGMLKGVTRSILIDLMEQEGREVEVRDVSLDEISEFDGAFMTGSLIEMIPISCIDDVMFDVQSVSNMVPELIVKYRKYVAEKSAIPLDMCVKSLTA